MHSPLRMPQHLVDRARALATGDQAAWEVPPLRHAATVVMVADAPEGALVYLQRRVKTMAFAAGMYVFPGGATEDEDFTEAARICSSSTGVPDYAIVDQHGIGIDTLVARVAAVRESAEEAAIALGNPLDLSYIAHWVTPEVEQRRYDTRFYGAIVSPEEIYESSQETDAQRWLCPQDALNEYFAGDMMMLPPTVAVLTDFAGLFSQGATGREAVDELANRTILPLMPRPFAETTTGDISWRLVDVRTGTELTDLSNAPAGSEVEGTRGVMKR